MLSKEIEFNVEGIPIIEKEGMYIEKKWYELFIDKGLIGGGSYGQVHLASTLDG